MKAALWTGIALLAACATVPPPPALVSARTAHEEVLRVPASLYDGNELQRANEALRIAEASAKADPGSIEAADTAYVALRRMETLLARAAQQKALTHRDAVARELVALHGRGAKNDAEAMAAKQTREELAQLRGQIEARSQREAQAAQAETTRQAQLAQQQLEETRRQLERERQARQQAEELARFAQVRQEERGLVISLGGNVLFASGKSTLLASARRRLDQIGAALKKAGDRRITIEGYTDSRGSEDTNQELSQERAQAVLEYLVEEGIPSRQITARGYGEDTPIASNSTPEGRAMNRRVEMVLANPPAEAPARAPATGGSGPR